MKAAKSQIKKDDKVKIIAGKDKGKIGKVLKINIQEQSILVEKVNIVKRHSKGNPQTGKGGGIIEKEAPINISNVMLMCGKCMKPSRIRSKKLENGNKVRICVSCNEVVDS